MRRIACVWIPHLPIERWQRRRAQDLDPPPYDLPVLLARPGPHGPVVHDASRAARLLGARAGMRVVDARAAAPELVVRPADPAGDAAFLARLAAWAGRWSPFVATDGPDGPTGRDGLVMDTTGVDHLFGGEARLLEDVEARLSALGLSARVALAPTRGAAWALARCGPERAICHDAGDLDPLPVAALRLPPETAGALGRLGLRTVGHLRTLPRPALARRFARAGVGARPLQRLDQALGALPEPVAPAQARAPMRAVLRLAEPALDAAPLLEDLAADLAVRLERAGLGARRLVLRVYRTDGETRAVSARLARPTRDPAHMHRLLIEETARLDPGFGFDAALLAAPDPERLDAAQPDLSGRIDEGEALARLVDRLSARLGAEAVRRPRPRGSHLPERALGWAPALEGGDPSLPGPPAMARPLTLLDPPERARVLYAVPEGPPVRLEWRRRRIEVARFAGPERIAPEWWIDPSGARLRDYYRIEEEAGRRYWIFREGLAGDGRGGAPEWFVHGLFG